MGTCCFYLGFAPFHLVDAVRRDAAAESRHHRSQIATGLIDGVRVRTESGQDMFGTRIDAYVVLNEANDLRT